MWRRAESLICGVAALILATGLGAALAPGAARAGTWTLVSCTRPDGTPAPIEGWSTSAVGSVGSDSGDTDSCASGGALSASTSGEAPQRAYEGPAWTFTAPSGSTILGGSVTATLTTPRGQAWIGTPNETYDAADVIANCQYNLACGSAGTLSDIFPISHAGGTHLYAVAVCVALVEGQSTCPAAGGVDAEVSIHSATIELSNSAAPSAGAVGGTLLEANASGTRDLTFTASDPGGPGIYVVIAQVDGKTLYDGTPDANGGRCAALGSAGGVLIFDSSQPCRSSESVDVPVNTTSVPDGQHALKVIVEDAAGNSSVVYNGAITTRNADTSSLGALPGPGASAGALALSGSQPNGVAASEQAQLHLGVPHEVSRSYAHRALHFGGRLLDSVGHPIAGASIDVLTQSADASQAQLIGHVGTDADGSFTVNAPDGPSRTILLAYRAFAGDTAYAARASVSESVAAGIALRVSPRHTASGGTIVLSGQVAGPLPRHGVLVELLVHYRGQWEPFRTPRTDAAGRFRVRYTFQGAVGRFPFRAEVPGKQAGFDYSRGVSEVVDVATH